ncbi:hypothetical protein MMC25_004596 [Agyrium rufum]|nr:hypothetical protein [Agyrium rufum]
MAKSDPLSDAHILVTGAGGFIGQALAKALLDEPGISQLTLTDVFSPPNPLSLGDENRHDDSKPQVTCLAADLTSPTVVKDLLSSPSFSNLTAVYLLHGLMSGASEANLDLGLKINIDSMRLILGTIRAIFPPPSSSKSSTSPTTSSSPTSPQKPLLKVIFPSSLAIYGPPSPSPSQSPTSSSPSPSELPTPITETNTVPYPLSTYGTAKLTTELLISDYTRRGLIDGRILRLPTVIVRPGKPSGAASSFCSGIIREPLMGQKGFLPVRRDTELWVCGARVVVRNLVWGGKVARERVAASTSELESGSRVGSGSQQHRPPVINLPGSTVTVEEMLSALEEVGGKEARGRVVEGRDEGVEELVYSWPSRLDCKRALECGFEADGTLKETVGEFVRDYLR